MATLAKYALRASTKRARVVSTLASPVEISKAVQNKATTLLDLRTPEEIKANPAPAGSLEWDVRNGAERPTLPADKEAPIVLF